MSDDGTIKPLIPEDDAIRSWASDWADTFDQDWNETKLQSYIGKMVSAIKPPTDDDEGPKGFKGRIIGYSIDTLTFLPEGSDGQEDRESVKRYSMLTSEGLQVAMLSGMEIEEVEEE